jgi:hypothetical protein
LGKKSNISLSVFNSLGELVYELNQNELETGRHTISFNGTDLTSGIYMYQLKVYGETGHYIVIQENDVNKINL